ncbi:MAG: hypothetical protein MUF81_14625 [Verrucomicrobia bacterium]|jgi:hypothetical protein|nr:hypothetical protein [Verrucomicrobiota bacterium]
MKLDNQFEQRLQRQPLREMPPAWREEILAAADNNRRVPPVREPTFAATAFRPLATLWRELVLPARMTWASIAAVWVVIGILSLSQSDQITVAARVSPATRQELRAASEQRQELLLELALLPTTEPAEPPKPNLQPRSQRQEEFLTA